MCMFVMRLGRAPFPHPTSLLHPELGALPGQRYELHLHLL